MSTLQTVDSIMKLNYGQGAERLQRCLYEGNTVLAEINKKFGAQNATGKALVAPVLYGGPQSMGANFASNQTLSLTGSAGSNRYSQWMVPFGDYSAVIRFERKMLKLAASNIGVYIDAKKEEIDQVLRQWGATFSWYLLNTHGHALCQITNAGTGIWQVQNAEDIVNIQPGMALEISNASATGDSPTDALLTANIGYVVGVNQTTAQFTTAVAADSTTLANPSGWTGGTPPYNVFRKGDFGGAGGGYTNVPVCDGFGDWCPSSDPTSTPWNGVVRTNNIAALSGIRIAASELNGMNNENRIKRLITRMSGRGFGPGDIVAVSPEVWQNIADGLESRGLRTAFGTDAKWGYSTLTVTAGGTSCKIISDRFMPSTSIYCWKKEYFSLHAAGGFPEVVNDDGLTMLRAVDALTYEMRFAAVPATLAAPGFLGRCPTA